MVLIDESPAPQPETTATLTRADILTELRESATQLDPAYADLYRSMSTMRLLGAADLASELLLAHSRYQRRHSGGRRAHSAAIFALLDQSNRVQLVAALAWVNMAFWLLPTPRPPGE